MTVWTGVAYGLIAVAFAAVLWGVRADRRDYDETRADLDEAAGDYHSPADRIAAIEAQAAEDRRVLHKLANLTVDHIGVPDDTGPIDMDRPTPQQHAAPTVPDLAAQHPRVLDADADTHGKHSAEARRTEAAA